MNTPQEKSPQRKVQRFILFGFLLICSIFLLTWLLQDVARSLIVLPFSYIVWIAKQVIQSVPQFFLWLGLIIFSLVMILKSFTGRQVITEENQISSLPLSRRSRLKFWLVQFSHGIDTHGRLAGFVHRLTMDVLSYTYHLPAWQVDKQIQDGDIPIPEELKKYIQISKQMPSYQQDILRNLQESLTNLISRLMKQKTKTNKLSSKEQELEVIITFLEKQLEIDHEHVDI
jgi:hypothetical protein